MLDLRRIVLESFLTEVNALKPGNVSRHAAGHGMSADDFILSAELVTPILCNSQLSLGERILQGVRSTKQKAGCNTNLGMLLLFAPIIMAAEAGVEQNIAALQGRLRVVLESADQANAALIFQAISEASPGGLGQSDKYDVNFSPDCGLLTAMAAAEKRDLIAKQYVTGFSDIFTTGFGCMQEFSRRWKSVEWATVACYLTFLSGFADSHIVRKFGHETAEGTRIKAIEIAGQFKKNKNPGNAESVLLEFDRELKDININPGTSADLTTASVLVYGLIEQKL